MLELEFHEAMIEVYRRAKAECARFGGQIDTRVGRKRSVHATILS